MLSVRSRSVIFAALNLLAETSLLIAPRTTSALSPDYENGNSTKAATRWVLYHVDCIPPEPAYETQDWESLSYWHSLVAGQLHE